MKYWMIAYTLVDSGFMGYFPECVAIETDSSGHIASRFVKVSAANKCNYVSQMDSVDEELLNFCLQLERDVIRKKVEDKKVPKWEDFQAKYFAKGRPDPAILHIRRYLNDYINRIQNQFFDRLDDRRLFIPQGNSPFMWKPVFVNHELPELKYRFVYQPEGLSYSLSMMVEEQNIDLKGAEIVSFKRARILKGNAIWEFDGEVEGAKLVPFFIKDEILIPKDKTEEYLQKFVVPLLARNQVEAEGFTIEQTGGMPHVVLSVHEPNSTAQPSLFENQPKKSTSELNIKFVLNFEYDDFVFRAGHESSQVKMVNEDGRLVFTKVERNQSFETAIAKSIEELGLLLSKNSFTLAYRTAIDWINKNYDQLAMMGVEVRFADQNSSKRKIFVGSCSISMEIDEGNDWFDVKGYALFGDIRIPIVVVLNHIRQNKPELRLPNGEYALIPQAWFDEYQTFSESCVFEESGAKAPKQFCAEASRLKRNGSAQLTLKGRLLKFVEKENVLEYALPKKFDCTLRNYQLSGYQWLRMLDDLGFGGVLADDMGLGKTIQTLCLLQWMREQNRGVTLLVVPTSLVYNWQIEAAKFAPELKVHVHAGKNRHVEASAFEQKDLIVTTYAILRRDIELLQNVSFNYLILDEAQAIKNPQSSVAQACLSIRANRFLTLTGTPIENSLSDLWSQMHLTNRNMLGDVNRFVRQCRIPGKTDYYRQLIAPFVMRRLKSDVLTELPEKSIFVQYCDMLPAQSEFYLQTRNNYRDQFLYQGEEGVSNTFQLLEGLLRMRQSANHPVLVDRSFSDASGKFEVVTQMLHEVVGEGNKVLVFSSFVEHLQLYKDYLEANDINYCYLDGATKEREKQVGLFQESDDHQVFLLSLKAGGTGLNLTRAGYVFLLDPWWNPAAEAQAFDRAHRIGQKNRVFVYKFISKNSIEEKILKLQEEKLEIFHSMIEAEKGIDKQLNREELIRLLE